MKALFIGLVLISLLSACGGSTQPGPTLESLAEREPLPSQQQNLQPSIRFTERPQQTITAYRELVSAAENDPGYASVLNRLADLELDYSQRAEQPQDTAEEVELQREIQTAVVRYRRYLDTFPDEPGNDRVLYQLSRALALQSEADEAMLYLDKIAQHYPDSMYRSETQFRRGEHLFVTGQYEEAATAYGEVVDRYPESPFFHKALYKLGWALFKQNNFDAALDRFMQLMDENQQLLTPTNIAEGTARTDQELIEDVLRAISLSFSYQNSKNPAGHFFNRYGKRDYEPLVYDSLAKLYLEKDRFLDAIEVYFAYIDQHLFSAVTPEFHDQIIAIYQDKGFSEDVINEKIAYIKNYTVNSNFWLRQTAATQQSLMPRIETHIHDLATHYHALARKSKKTRDYQQAILWYREYLNTLPDHKKSAEVNQLLADTYYEIKDYPNSVTEYERTAYDYPDYSGRANAAYAAIVIFDSWIKNTKDPVKQTQLTERQINSEEKFTQNFYTDSRTASLLLRLAEQYYAKNNYLAASENAQRLTQYPGVDLGSKNSGNQIYANALFELKQYPESEQAYRVVLQNRELGSKQRNIYLDQLAASIYLQAQLLQQQGNATQAASEYLRVASTVPGSKYSVTAEYDAATQLLVAQQWHQAIEVLTRFRLRYAKQAQWQKGTSEKLALAYSKTGQQSKAAAEIMLLAKQSPAAEQQQLKWQAIALYREGDDHKNAMTHAKSYIHSYPDPYDKSLELRQYMADRYQISGETAKRNYWLKQIIATDRKAGKQRTNRSRTLAAKASLELSLPLYQSFRKIPLKTPLKTSLQKKKLAMQKSLKALSAAAQYKIAEVTTSSTFYIGEIYRQFAADILGSERPKNLNEDELEEYNYLLEDQAYPFEEKAIEIHQSNVSRISSGQYDDWTQKSLSTLATLLPFRYAKNERIDALTE